MFLLISFLGNTPRRKDILYSSTGRSLDVYPPSPAATPVTMTPAAASTPDTVTMTPAPVVVFIYGGAWSSGDKETYTLLGKTLAEAGLMVVIPNYTLYPRGKIPTMLQEVGEAVEWTLAHCHEYGGDPNRVYVCGHSAGAQLACMQRVLVALEAGPTLGKVRGMIGLSGVYDIPVHLEFERGRGVDEVSGMERACGSTQEGMAAYSPTLVVRGIGKADNSAAFGARIPKTLLLHGSGDGTVPHYSSQEFYQALQLVGADSQLRIIPNVGHVDVVIGKTLSHSLLVSLTKTPLQPPHTFM